VTYETRFEDEVYQSKLMSKIKDDICLDAWDDHSVGDQSDCQSTPL